MLFPGVKKIGRELGLRRTANTVFGNYKGFLISLGDGVGFKRIVMNIGEVEAESLADALAKVTEFVDKQKLGGFELYLQGRVHYLELRIQEYLWSASRSRILAVLDSAIDMLTDLGLHPRSACWCCCSTSDLTCFAQDMFPVCYCSACYTRVVDELSALGREDHKYLQGFLGAFCVTLAPLLVGVYAWVWQDGLLSIVAAVSVAASTLLSLPAYLWFGGAPRNYARWIILSAGVLAVISANIVACALSLWSDGFKFSEAFTQIRTNPGVRSAIGFGIFQSLFLGIWGLAYGFNLVSSSETAAHVDPGRTIEAPWLQRLFAGS